MSDDNKIDEVPLLFKSIISKNNDLNAKPAPTGKPMFAPEQVCVMSALTKVMRYGMVIENVTENDWRASFRRTARDDGEDLSRIANIVNNGKVAVQKDPVTWNTFLTAFHAMGYDLNNLVVTFTQRDTGKILNLSLRDANEFCSSMSSGVERTTTTTISHNSIKAEDSDDTE